MINNLIKKNINFLLLFSILLSFINLSLILKILFDEYYNNLTNYDLPGKTLENLNNNPSEIIVPETDEIINSIVETSSDENLNNNLSKDNIKDKIKNLP
jgi:hypothetical protein